MTTVDGCSNVIRIGRAFTTLNFSKLLVTESEKQ